MTITRYTRSANADNYSNNNSTLSIGVSGEQLVAGDRVVYMIWRYAPSQDVPVAGDIAQISGGATAGAFTLDAVAEYYVSGTGYFYAMVYSAPITVGGADVVITYTGTSGNYMGGAGAAYHSDAGDITVEDGDNTGTGTSLYPATSNGTSVGKAVFCGVHATNDSAENDRAPDSPWYQLYEIIDGSAYCTGGAADQITSGGVTDAASWTLTSSTDWSAAMAVYNEPGGEEECNTFVVMQVNTVTTTNTVIGMY